MTNRKWLARGIACAAIGALTFTALADKPTVGGAFSFEPITGSAVVGSLPANAPFKLPAGFSQEVVSDELGLFSDGLNIYTSVDWPDMTQSNETGKWSGRYLYRTHEVRPPPANPNGAVSVIDLETGEAKILVQRADWEALDGLKWTPWGTLLFAEETLARQGVDPDYPLAEAGLLYEATLDPQDPSTATGVEARPALGSLSHEGIGIDSEGNVYVIDEFSAGGIYKFVPDRRGDLSEGQLYVLKVDDTSLVTNPDRVGPAKWIALDRDDVQIDAQAAAVSVGGTSYGRPEDVEIRSNVMYVAITSENRVLAIDLQGQNPVVSNFVKAGVNVPGGSSGLANPDNLVFDAHGNLYVIEDNLPGDIWCAIPDDKNKDGYSDKVVLFASLSTPGSEPTGGYFGKDQHVMYINVQHASTGNDMTIAISKD